MGIDDVVASVTISNEAPVETVAPVEMNGFGLKTEGEGFEPSRDRDGP